MPMLWALHEKIHKFGRLAGDQQNEMKCISDVAEPGIQANRGGFLAAAGSCTSGAVTAAEPGLVRFLQRSAWAWARGSSANKGGEVLLLHNQHARSCGNRHAVAACMTRAAGCHHNRQRLASARPVLQAGTYPRADRMAS